MKDLFDFFSEPAEKEPENQEYEAFVEKFKPKKTTDDCYTPDGIYDAVKNWAVDEYGLVGRRIIRPFWPGGDYEKEKYPKGCVVIDNPPFSILSKIITWYNKKGIDYFLFAPALTVISTCSNKCNMVISNSEIVYHNGATVRTAFVTNLGQYKVHVSSELYEILKTASERIRKEKARELPKYVYPDEVLTAAVVQKIAKYGQTLKIRPEECCFVRSLDSQKAQGAALFGGGLLLSERAAAERAAAERAAAERAAAERAAATKWKLSEREWEIVRGMGSC